MTLRDFIARVKRAVTTIYRRQRKATDGGTLTSTRSSRTLLGSIRHNEFIQSIPFLLPTLVMIGWFIYGAIIWNLVISLTDFQGFGTPSYEELDLEQYVRAIHDPGLLAAARNTFVLLLAFTVLCLVVGLGLAILLDQEIRFRGTIRLIYLFPFSLSFIVTAQVWLWLYNYSNGLVNTTIRAVGLPAPHWIGNPKIVLTAIIIALVWQFSGYAMVVYLAGLRSIPTAHFEAAKVDGASTIRIYQRIILPQLRASTVSASVVLMVFALKAFDFIYALFGSYQPQKGADILATKMVREAFRSQEWAYGAAIAIILFLLAMAVISPYLYSQYRRGKL
ncbi:carbohydrate ABC transporter permease [Halorussus salinisoli]|uniref:carbohydrate ABC transporter permease n=1 Tax=Halorussus salinisoli TaxID=2558242 RepID=UPI0010C18F2A|nr:sugar ABC transporter permease [Halorussus salinisoli]